MMIVTEYAKNIFLCVPTKNKIVKTSHGTYLVVNGGAMQCEMFNFAYLFCIDNNSLTFSAN